jgi:predicted outer membrane repeat protein
LRVTNGRPGIVVAGGTAIYPVTLEDVIVSGNARGSGTVLGRNASGIELIRSTLNLVASLVRGNGVSSAGPGIYASDSNIYARESVISKNLGGGIMASFSPMVLDHTVIRDNTNSVAGGGLSITSSVYGPVQLVDSRVVDNQASAGGGIWSAGDPVVMLQRSVVSGNRATGDGGGIYHANLFSSPVQLRVVDSVVTRNTAGGRGGGIYNDLDVTTLLSLEGATSIVNNRATLTGGGIYNQGSVSIAPAVSIRSNEPDNCIGVAC